jgi:hypothetical protein
VSVPDRVAGAARTVADGLQAARTVDRRRRTVTVVGLVTGLAAASVHWSGLFLLGVLVGLPRRSLGRAVIAGAVAGVCVLVLTALVASTEPRTTLTALEPLTYLTLALGAAPVVGSLVRGVV